ncbi:hypothetical protein VTL71DRAFT_7534 [Oculimacula yallundae]|uniref:Uncharacterized protein n=1 Tax=Oculimacula yallundae TaxID=86028 RepID=A0ABR4BVX7_9HELO
MSLDEKISTIKSFLDDLDDRFAARVEDAIREVRLGTELVKVDDLIHTIHNHMVRSVDETIDFLAPTVGRYYATAIAENAEKYMLGMLPLLAAQLREISVYGVASAPYIRKPGYNPYRTDNPRPIYHYAPKKATRAPAPVPGEGLGPNPVPTKNKANGGKKWDDGNDVWGQSENWEELALHVAYRERLVAEKAVKDREVAEAEEALKTKEDLKGKKGKA